MQHSTLRRAPRPLVVLGLSGDLGRDELLPALAHLIRTGRLDVPIVGVSRDTDFDAEAALRDLLDEPTDRLEVHTVHGSATDSATFERIAELVGRRVAVYAALPPAIVSELGDAVEKSPLRAEVLAVEKPFGDDARSARRLHERLVGFDSIERVFLAMHNARKAKASEPAE